MQSLHPECIGAAVAVAQPPIAVSDSAFTATLPPRSLVTDDIRS